MSTVEVGRCRQVTDFRRRKLYQWRLGCSLTMYVTIILCGFAGTRVFLKLAVVWLQPEAQTKLQLTEAELLEAAVGGEFGKVK